MSIDYVGENSLSQLITEIKGKIPTDIPKRWYGECTTAQNTQQKVVAIDGFTSADLVKGVVVTVKFSQNAYASGYNSLNVNNTGAKTIYKRGTTSSMGAWLSGAVITFVFDGNYWIMADYQDNTDANVTQTLNSNVNSDYPILFKGDATTQTRTQGTQFNGNATINPSTGTLSATKLVGDGSGITDLPVVCTDTTTAFHKKGGALKIGTITVNGTDVDLYCRGSGSDAIVDIDDDFPIEKTYRPMSVTDVWNSLYYLSEKLYSEAINPLILRVQALEEASGGGKTVKVKEVTATVIDDGHWNLGMGLNDYPNVIAAHHSEYWNFICRVCRHYATQTWTCIISSALSPAGILRSGEPLKLTVYYLE